MDDLYKGAAIDYVRRALRARGEAVESAFLERLSPEVVETYQSCLAISWVSIRHADPILGIASEILYPNDPEGIIRLGRDLATDNLNGIYRVLLRFTTVPFVMKQSARLWGTYHRKGEPRIAKDPEANRGTFMVEGYPEFPLYLRDSAYGFMWRTLQLTGARNIQGTADSSDPDCWRWEFVWE